MEFGIDGSTSEGLGVEKSTTWAVWEGVCCIHWSKRSQATSRMHRSVRGRSVLSAFLQPEYVRHIVVVLYARFFLVTRHRSAQGFSSIMGSEACSGSAVGGGD